MIDCIILPLQPVFIISAMWLSYNDRFDMEWKENKSNTITCCPKTIETVKLTYLYKNLSVLYFLLNHIQFYFLRIF